MKLDLLIKRPHRSIERIHTISKELNVHVICQLAGDRTNPEDIDALIQLEEPLKLDFWRATKLKKRIDESFLKSCLEKWSHSQSSNLWTARSKDIGALIIAHGTSIAKRGELLVAVWGNIALLQKGGGSTWHVAAQQTQSEKGEAHCAIYHIDDASSSPLLAICPNSAEELELLSATSGDFPELQHFDSWIAGASPKTNAWVYCKLSTALHWPLIRLGHWCGRRCRNALRALLALSLSRTKIAMIFLGLILSIFCTVALLMLSERAWPVAATPAQSPRVSANSFDARSNEEYLAKTRFQPYASWIAWLHAPPETARALQSDSLSGSMKLYGPPEQQKVELSSISEPIVTEDDLKLTYGDDDQPELRDLEFLRAQIQRDLANLHKHQLSLSKLAERGAPVDAPSPTSHRFKWLEEEHKRSAQHLLIARRSLEKISRRYSELSFLTSQIPPPSERVQEWSAKSLPDRSRSLHIRWFRWRILLHRARWTGSSPHFVLDECADIDLFGVDQFPSSFFAGTNSRLHRPVVVIASRAT